VEEHFDVSNPEGFEKALRAKIPRPFLFGPIEFEGLNEENFDSERAREIVEAALLRQNPSV
jgi:hypothetical protein